MSETNEWEIELPNEVTLKDLNQFCENLVQLREEKEDINEQLKTVQEKITELEQKIILIMSEHALPNFKSSFGSISIRTIKSITQPAGIEKKLELFEYLRAQGIFEELVSVNSRTLSSWAAKEIEAKEKEGVFGWVPPGLSSPTEIKALSVRKK